MQTICKLQKHCAIGYFSYLCRRKSMIKGMKKLSTLFCGLLLSIAVNAQSDQFAITLMVDSAIASQPQKVYLYSMIEKQMQLHDSLSIDSVHRIGTMHGKVPYEYNVNILFTRRGPQMVPVVANNGDRISIHVGDEDEGFNLRYIDKVEGSPSTLEMARYYHQQDSLRRIYTKLNSQMQLYDLTDEQRDSIMTLVRQADVSRKRHMLEYANTGRSPYCVIDAASDVFYPHRRNPSMSPYTEDEVDAMMNSLLVRFPDYPPMKAFVNDSTLGSYTTAESFAVFEQMQLRQYSRRFQTENDDDVIRPLKVGDYMNMALRNGPGGNVNTYRGKYVLVDFWASWCQPCMAQMANIRLAAEMFKEDLQVCMIGMDENRKQWWSTVKEYDMRKKDATQTAHPYTIYHYRAYDDKTGKMYADYHRLDIKTIPHNYLVDRSGRIIAKNISITLAIDKLKELIEKEKKQ